MKRIAIIGASGQLGSALVEAFKGCDLITPSRESFDIERDAVEKIIYGQDPDLVINAAAFHDVSACEREPHRALLANGERVGWMAKACSESKVSYATISTDYVLDDEGNENPLNAYGESKQLGERLALIWPRTYVFRTSGLYGKSGRSNKGPHFVERVLQAAEKGEAFRAVDDVRFSPSYAPHVAKRIREIVDARDYGLHHVAGTGQASWYELAMHARLVAFTSGKLHAMGELVRASVEDFQETFRRPKSTQLGNGTLPDWREGIKEYVQQRRRSGA